MADDKDPPIQPQSFLGGVTVINIGDVRVQRGLSRRAHSSCPHQSIVYDKNERRVWCEDCERDIEAWRRKNMVPACPHCHGGLFPELFKNGVPMVGKQFAERKARK